MSNILDGILALGTIGILLGVGVLLFLVVVKGRDGRSLMMNFLSSVKRLFWGLGDIVKRMMGHD